jgi:hypothetical protein
MATSGGHEHNAALVVSWRRCEKRPFEQAGQNIFKEECCVADDADVVATCAIYRDDRLYAELEFIGHVNDAGINRPGGSLSPVKTLKRWHYIPLLMQMRKGHDCAGISRKRYPRAPIVESSTGVEIAKLRAAYLVQIGR